MQRLGANTRSSHAGHPEGVPRRESQDHSPRPMRIFWTSDVPS
jgi:hypothetical protein